MKAPIYYSIIALLCCAVTIAQSNEPQLPAAIADEDGHFNDLSFSPGFIVQRQAFAEANLNIGEVLSNGSVLGIAGYRIGAESNLRTGRDFIIAPKVGYEVCILIGVVRLSAINYFKGSTSEFRILPEVGLSMFGLINITYGYNIRVTSPAIGDISSHRLAISINLNKELFDAFNP